MKKAQSLSLNFIILAVIGIAILLIILYIVADKAGIFAQNVHKDCKVKGDDGKCPQGTAESIIKDKDGSFKTCCVNIGVG